MIKLDSVYNEGQVWVHPHPVYSNYGMAFDSRNGNTEIRLVHGNIQGKEKLEVIEDHNAPVPVLSWYFTQAEIVINTVNDDVEVLNTSTQIDYTI